MIFEPGASVAGGIFDASAREADSLSPNALSPSVRSGTERTWPEGCTPPPLVRVSSWWGLRWTRFVGDPGTDAFGRCTAGPEPRAARMVRVWEISKSAMICLVARTSKSRGCGRPPWLVHESWISNLKQHRQHDLRMRRASLYHPQATRTRR